MTDDPTPEQLEAIDLASLTVLEKVQVTPDLYRLSPPGDDLARRQWVSDRLGLSMYDVNRILWHAGVRWLPIPRKPSRRRRPRLSDAP